MRKRPLGITIVAVLSWIGVVQYSVLAALAVFDRATLDGLLRALSPSGAGPEALHNAMGGWLPVYYLAMTGFSGIMALGFWRLWNWVRLVMLAMIAISMVLMLGELPGLLAAPTTKALGLTALRIGLSALWGWYMMRRSVREAFRPGSSASATSARQSSSFTPARG